MYELLRPEIVNQSLVALAIGLPTVAMALNHAQRIAIRERDGHRCQAPFSHKCSIKQDKYEGNVHHIIPQAWAEHQNGEPEEVRDSPERVLLICEASHQMIHPDLASAKLKFHWDKDAFSNMGKAHEKDAKRGLMYWFTRWDNLMLQVARRNTMRAKATGWEYPPHNHRNNGH